MTAILTFIDMKQVIFTIPLLLAAAPLKAKPLSNLDYLSYGMIFERVNTGCVFYASMQDLPHKKRADTLQLYYALLLEKSPLSEYAKENPTNAKKAIDLVRGFLWKVSDPMLNNKQTRQEQLDRRSVRACVGMLDMATKKLGL